MMDDFPPVCEVRQVQGIKETVAAFRQKMPRLSIKSFSTSDMPGWIKVDLDNGTTGYLDACGRYFWIGLPIHLDTMKVPDKLLKGSP